MIHYSTWIDLPDGKAIVLDNRTLLRVDLNPGAFCPVEARFPDKANQLLFIALLSPDVLGTIGETAAARRASWVFELSHGRAIQAMQRLLPLIHDTRRNAP